MPRCSNSLSAQAILNLLREELYIHYNRPKCSVRPAFLYNYRSTLPEDKEEPVDRAGKILYKACSYEVYVCFAGVAAGPEMIPVEPDPDNAGAGKCREFID